MSYTLLNNRIETLTNALPEGYKVIRWSVFNADTDQSNVSIRVGMNKKHMLDIRYLTNNPDKIEAKFFKLGFMPTFRSFEYFIECLNDIMLINTKKDFGSLHRLFTVIMDIHLESTGCEKSWTSLVKLEEDKQSFVVHSRGRSITIDNTMEINGKNITSIVKAVIRLLKPEAIHGDKKDNISSHEVLKPLVELGYTDYNVLANVNSPYAVVIKFKKKKMVATLTSESADRVIKIDYDVMKQDNLLVDLFSDKTNMDKLWKGIVILEGVQLFKDYHLFKNGITTNINTFINEYLIIASL